MEILGPNFLEIALLAAAAFTLLSFATLLVLVAVRLVADFQLQRTASFRAKAEPLISRHLAGQDSTAEIITVLKADPREARSLLMELSESLDPTARLKLRPLFAALPTAGHETSLLTSSRWDVRLKAAEYLGYLAAPDSRDALLAALEDQTIAVRFAAAHALASIGDPSGIKPILRAFDTPGEMNQRRVTEIISEFGQAGIEPLISVIKNADDQFSNIQLGVAIRVLGILRAREAGPILISLLGSTEYRIRLNAARALGQIGENAAQSPLASLSGDSSWEVRNAAVQSLGKLHATSQIPLLARALGDRNWWVRFSAGQALCSLGDEGLTALRKAMLSSTDQFASDMSRQILEEQRLCKSMR